MKNRTETLLRVVPWVVAVGVAGIGPTSTRAEQPPWQSLRLNTYVIRSHTFYEPAATDTSGIWNYDLSTDSYRRLRPFYYNASKYNTPDYPGDNGNGSYLTAMGDRLVFEAWPSMIELDLASMRIVRRYAELDPALQAYGWVVQGPIIDADLASKTALLEGLYGVPRCLYGIVDYSGFGHKECPTVEVPGTDGPLMLAPDMAPVLLRRTLGSFGSRLEPVANLDAGDQPSLITLDTARNGLWIGAPQRMTFHPIADGTVGTGTDSMDLTAPPINEPYAWLGQLFNQPQSDNFFIDWGIDSYRHHSVMQFADGTFTLLEDEEQQRPTLTYAAIGETPPSEEKQTIPIVVHTSGKNGTYWTSDLYLYNPSEEAMTVSIRRVTKPEVVKNLELPAHGGLAIPDVLSWVGGGPAGDGTKHDALVLTTDYRWGENLVAAARVWTPDSDPQLRAAGGTMGQAVPAVPDTIGYSNHLPWLGREFGSGDESTADIFDNQSPYIEPSQLVLDNRIPGRFRFNIGLVNDRDEPLTVTLTAVARQYLEDGGADTTRSIQLDPHSVKIVDIENLFPSAIASNYPPIFGVSGDPAALWMSMVDNITGDATFIPFSLLNQLGDDFTRYAVPAAAHLPGRNGTFWTTDLYSVFRRPATPDYEDILTRIWFHPSEPSRNCGGAGPELMEEEVEGQVPMDDTTWLATLHAINYPLIYPDQEQWTLRHVFPDVVHLFAQCATDNNVRGGFELREGSWMSGFTRTYTTRADGGTYGGMLPFYPPHGWPVQHFAGLVVSPTLRINVGLYNGDGEHAITHRLTLYDADGVKVAQNELTLEPWANLVEPLETVLNLPKGSLADGAYGLTVLPLDDEANGVGGRSWAFVSLVDNVTGDSTNWW